MELYKKYKDKNHECQEHNLPKIKLFSCLDFISRIHSDIKSLREEFMRVSFEGVKREMRRKVLSFVVEIREWERNIVFRWRISTSTSLEY